MMALQLSPQLLKTLRKLSARLPVLQRESLRLSSELVAAREFEPTQLQIEVVALQSAFHGVRCAAFLCEREATVRFSVVGATGRTIAFPDVHVRFAPPTVHRSVVL
jgi:hypothetical protein